MKRTLIMGAASAGRGLRVLVTSVMLCAGLAVAAAGIASPAASAATSAGADGGCAIRTGRAGRGTGDLALVNRLDDQNLLGKTRPG